MRGVSARWTAVVLAVLLLAVPVWADEAPTSPTDPPQARIQPPGGYTSNARLQPPVGILIAVKLWLQSRLSIPNG